MRRLFWFTGLLLAVLLVTLPALAGSRRYAEDRLDEWVESAETDGYEVIYTELDLIGEDEEITYYLDLEPGVYHFYAEGGEDIEDIDMYVWDEDGDELDSDTLSDNFPMCTFEIYESQKIEVEISAFSIVGDDEDYFCFVAAAEPVAVQRERESGDLDDILDYWIDWAEEEGYDVVLTDTGVLRSEDSDTFAMNLDAGTYHIYAESIHEEDDIDLYVWDEEDDEIGSDTTPDNYPIVSFEIRHPGEVEIEIVSYDLVGSSTDYALVIAIEGEGGIWDRDIDGRHRDRITDDEDWEYVRGVADDYMDAIIDEGGEVMFDDIQLIEIGSANTFRITLGRGDYIAYAEGGLKITDLDMRVYDDDGELIDEDTLSDNYPICEFSARRSSTFEIEVEIYSMEEGYDEGFFMLAITRD